MPGTWRVRGVQEPRQPLGTGPQVQQHHITHRGGSTERSWTAAVGGRCAQKLACELALPSRGPCHSRQRTLKGCRPQGCTKVTGSVCGPPSCFLCHHKFKNHFASIITKSEIVIASRLAFGAMRSLQRSHAKFVRGRPSLVKQSECNAAIAVRASSSEGLSL